MRALSTIGEVAMLARRRRLCQFATSAKQASSELAKATSLFISAMPPRATECVGHNGPSRCAISGLIRRPPVAQASLRGVNAAVVGLRLAALYQPIWTVGITNAARAAPRKVRRRSV